ncbi:hypothetical protein TWF730_001859 [Orbilia blumenaviensis]|uniref:Uncharacterized protein n=1 Tax=Orbilia blumenaviensis TaxID=1796055 RepID=A0AAV9UCY1_9PEZI
MAPSENRPPPPPTPPRKELTVVERIQDVIVQISNYMRIDKSELLAKPMKSFPPYMPILQPYENITFNGPTIGPPNTVEEVDVWREGTCRMDIFWTFMGTPTHDFDVIWKDMIFMTFYIKTKTDNEWRLEPIGTPRTKCVGKTEEACFSALPNRLTMRAIPQHQNRNSRDPFTFNRDYIQFYYGEDTDPGFLAFHTDTNGNAEDNYLIPTRFPRCTPYEPDTSPKYYREWIPNDPLFLQVAHRVFRVTGDDGQVTDYWDGDALRFSCLFPCPTIG